MLLTLNEIAKATSGEILAGDPAVFVGGNAPGGLAIDTRNMTLGHWFVTLLGKQGRNGHDFVEAAIASGVAGLILSDRFVYESRVRPLRPDLPALLVPDTTLALADIARALLDKFAPFVIAITGTVGKTSVKESVAHVLSSRWPTLKNPHNWNTEIGLPLTVFNIAPDHRVAVLECASRGIGQIHALSEIARPDIAVIAAIGPGHLSEFGSVDDVAKAKWEIVDGLRPGGIVVAPGESPYTEIYRSDYPVVTFGMDESNDYHPVDFHHGELDIAAKIATPEGLFETLIPGSSQADLSNTLCAAAVCNQVRVAGPGGVEMLNLAEISHKLRTRPGIEGREELIVRPSGVEVVFDAYNSNPMSLLNALCSLARRTHLSTGSPIKRHVAILGDMLELGKNEQDYHRHAGREVGELRIDVLLTVGKLAELIRISAEETRGGEISGAHYPSTPALVGELSKWVRPGDLVLIKASRAIALEGLLKGDW